MLTENQKKAYHLRQHNKTFKEIGVILGVSTTRAREIYYRALRKVNNRAADPHVGWPGEYYKEIIYER